MQMISFLNDSNAISRSFTIIERDLRYISCILIRIFRICFYSLAAKLVHSLTRSLLVSRLKTQFRSAFLVFCSQSAQRMMMNTNLVGCETWRQTLAGVKGALRLTGIKGEGCGSLNPWRTFLVLFEYLFDFLKSRFTYWFLPWTWHQSRRSSFTFFFSTFTLSP